MPSIEKLGTFGPAQQTGFAQLAIQYCSQMVETPALRTAFFGDALNPAATATSSFGAQRRRTSRTADLRHQRRCCTKGKNYAVLEWEPERRRDMIPTELDDLIDKLVAGPTGAAPVAARVR